MKKNFIFFIYGIMCFTLWFNSSIFGQGQSNTDVQQILDYTAETLRDPFKSWIPEEAKVVTIENGASSLKLPALTVQGIIVHSSKPTAIINNQVVGVGDVISEVKITEIKKEGITVMYQGQIFTIPSPSSIIKEKQQNTGGQDEKE